MSVSTTNETRVGAADSPVVVAYKKAFADFPEERDEVLTELFKTAVPKKWRLMLLALSQATGSFASVVQRPVKRLGVSPTPAI